MNAWDCTVADGVLTVYCCERIDTTNAADAENTIRQKMNENPHEHTTLDFAATQYISSVGLRMLLRFRKEDAGLKIINVSSEVYDVFEMTGFTEMLNIEKAYRELDLDGCTVIGKGAKGTVYRYNDDTIVKVYRNPDSLDDIRRERELARSAFVLGIPTAISYDIVRVGDLFGSVFELLDSKSFSELIAESPDQLEHYATVSAELMRLIHSTEAQKGSLPDIKDTIYGWADTVEAYFEKEQIEKLRALIRNTPDTLNVLHCDYHTNNIMLQGDEPLLVDMDTLSQGHPVFELANVYIAFVAFGRLGHKMVEDFLGFSYDLAVKFWDIFLPAYINGKADVQEVQKKVELMGLLRLMRHVARRKATTDEEKAIVENCRKDILALMEQVDSLDF